MMAVSAPGRQQEVFIRDKSLKIWLDKHTKKNVQNQHCNGGNNSAGSYSRFQYRAWLISLREAVFIVYFQNSLNCFRKLVSMFI